MAAPLSRRPRFLADVPEIPAPEPLRLAPANSRAFAARPQRLGSGGFAPGSDELAELRREAMEKVMAAVQTLRAQADLLAEQARADAIEIGFQVARKILETELRQSPDTLFALVRSAVRRAGSSRRVGVHLHPDDAASIQEQIGRGGADDLSAARIELVPDPGLQHGDCLVDTDFGQVDGRLATRLA